MCIIVELRIEIRDVDEMVLVVQTVSYINYELLIEWPWQ